MRLAGPALFVWIGSAALVTLAVYAAIDHAAIAPYVAIATVLSVPVAYLLSGIVSRERKAVLVQARGESGVSGSIANRPAIADIMIASAILLLTSPILLAVALFLKVKRATVLERQPKVGLHGDRFAMWSLSPSSANALGTNLSFVARLPVFLNVLSGDMRVFGPKPLDTVESPDLEVYRRRFSVRPGVWSIWDVVRYEFDPQAVRFVEVSDRNRMLKTEEWHLSDRSRARSRYGNLTLVLKIPVLWTLQRAVKLIPPLKAALGLSRDVRTTKAPSTRIGLYELMNSGAHSILIPVYAAVFYVLAGGVVSIINTVLGRAHLTAFVPYFLRGAGAGDLVRYYAFSVAIALALAIAARFVEFNFMCGDVKVADRARRILFVTSLAIGLYALQDNFIAGVRNLGFGAVSIAFIFWYWRLGLSVLHGLNTAPNLTDAGALLRIRGRGHRSGLAKRLYFDLTRGRVFRALRRLQGVELRDRDEFKLAALTYLRLRLHRRALEAAEHGNRALMVQGEKLSETLLSVQALALVHCGKHGDAEKTLLEAESSFPQNPYFPYHRAYVYWQGGDLYSALDNVDKAIEMFGGSKAVDSLPALALRVHICCDLATVEYAHDKVRANERAADARALIALAIRHADELRRRTRIELGGHLDYLAGYASMMCRDYDRAWALLRRCIWRSSHLASIFRVGLLRMIGTSNYDSSERQFMWILNTLQVSHAIRDVIDIEGCAECEGHGIQSGFERMVRRALNHARAARQRRVMFTDEIVFYHFQETFPDAAVLTHQPDRTSDVWRPPSLALPRSRRVRI